MRRSRGATFVLLAAIAIAGGARSSAHRLDEFLQAARIAVEPDRVVVEMSLTPGTSVADGVIAEIDVDRNGVLSQEEQRAYAARVLSSLTLRLDDTVPLGMVLESSSFPDLAALRSGDGAIAIRAGAALSRLAAGSHRLLFRNQHAPARSVYLANALVPESHEVAVTAQHRDGDQRELMIDLAITQAPVASATSWLSMVLISALVLAAAPILIAQPNHFTGLPQVSPGAELAANWQSYYRCSSATRTEE